MWKEHFCKLLNSSQLVDKCDRAYDVSNTCDIFTHNEMLTAISHESFDIPSARPQRDHSLYNLLHSDDETNSHMDSNNESDTVSDSDCDSDCEVTSTYFPHEHSNNEFRSCNDVIKTKTFVNQNMWRTKVQNKTSKKLSTA